jgi:hypothetical protein
MVPVRGVLSHGGLRKGNQDVAVVTGFCRSPGIAGILCLYFRGLHVSNEQMAHELAVNSRDMQQMTAQLREGMVKKAHGDPVKRGGVRRSLCDCRP